MLAGVVIVGMLCWSMPGFKIWGALAIGLLMVWVLWLLWRTVQADRTIPAHPIHLALIVPVMILIFHLARHGLRQQQDPTLLHGALDMSMIFHFWLLATGVLVSQSLLPRAARHSVVLSLAGAAMMGGAVLAVVWGTSDHARPALGFVGFAGVGVWLTPLWGAAASHDGWPHPLKSRGLRIACLAVAAAAAVMLAWFTPHEAVISLGVLAVVLLLAGLLFPRRRLATLSIACLLAAAAIVGFLVRPRWPEFHGLRVGLFGLGENAFAKISASDTGLAVLAGTVGWVGLVWLVGGIVICGLYLLLGARRGGGGDRGRAIAWTAAAALATCALLSGGGLAIPSVTLAAAFTWGLLPTMLSRPSRRWSGLGVLIGLTVLIMLLGLAPKGGLANWVTFAFGRRDEFLHGCAGFFLALVVAWLAGSRQVKWGLLGMVIVALAGGIGEALQGLLAARTMSFADWVSHTIGCAAAVPLYLLCLGSRCCESPDAPCPKGIYQR